MNTTDVKLSKEEFKLAIASFKGTEGYHLHRLANGMHMKLTDGAAFVREHAGSGAYWLFDMILSWQFKLTKHPFQEWKLLKHGNGSWYLQCTDGNENFLAGQDILSSDFPLDQFTIWLIEGVALLPSEH